MAKLSEAARMALYALNEKARKLVDELETVENQAEDIIKEMAWYNDPQLCMDILTVLSARTMPFIRTEVRTRLNQLEEK